MGKVIFKQPGRLYFINGQYGHSLGCVKRRTPPIPTTTSALNSLAFIDALSTFSRDGLFSMPSKIS